MRRADLEHVIRASSAIADSDGVVIVGSQAILGQYPYAPSELLVSIEADVYPRSDPEKAILILADRAKTLPVDDRIRDLVLNRIHRMEGESGWRERGLLTPPNPKRYSLHSPSKSA